MICKKKILMGLVIFGILVSPISTTEELETKEEPYLSKLTKITLINEIIRVESEYKFKCYGEQKNPPILTIGSDAILIDSELKNIKCFLNNTPIEYVILNVEDNPKLKYICAIVDNVDEKLVESGDICEFYLSYEVDTSDVHIEYSEGTKEKIIIGFYIGLYTPKVEKEITSQLSFSVCSNMSDWLPFHPIISKEIKYNKEENCEIYNSKIVNIKKGGIIELLDDPVSFQKIGSLNITSWEQKFTIDSGGNLVYEFAVTEEIPLKIPLDHLIPLYYSGVNPTPVVKFTLKNGEVKHATQYGSRREFKEKTKGGGFGYIFTSSEERDYLNILANHPELDHFEVYFRCEYPEYSFFDQIEEFTYELEYRVLFERMDPDADIIVKFILANNFFIEKYTPNLKDFNKSDSILEFHFKSGDGPFEHINIVFSDIRKREMQEEEQKEKERIKSKIKKIHNVNSVFIVIFILILILRLLGKIKIDTTLKFSKTIGTIVLPLGIDWYIRDPDPISLRNFFVDISVISTILIILVILFVYDYRSTSKKNK